MLDNIFETERLIIRRFGYDKQGQKLNLNKRKEEALRIFKSWSNPQNYRYNEITWDFEDVNEMFDYDFPTDWGMYYMIAELKETGEIVATCRFGQYYDDETNSIWDFGYNVLRGDDKESYTLEDVQKVFFDNGLIKDEVYWGKGYANEILGLIMSLARNEGKKKLRSGADIDNFGSIKAMVKKGFTFSCIDEDGDPCMEYDLYSYDDKEISKEKIESNWKEYLKIINSKRDEFQDKINENYIDQYSNALTYYFLSKISKGINENDITKDLGKLNEKEFTMVMSKLCSLEERWNKRNAIDPHDERVARHLEYCAILKSICKNYETLKNKII